jgi:hypothetical protein
MRAAFASVTFDPITGTGPFQENAASNPAGTLESFFSILLGAFTIIGGLTFLIYFVIGAFNYLTAQGSPEKVTKAQHYLTNALIGLILIVMTWAITGVLGAALGYNILDIAKHLTEITP